jgi:hypothetical protein
MIAKDNATIAEDNAALAEDRAAIAADNATIAADNAALAADNAALAKSVASVSNPAANGVGLVGPAAINGVVAVAVPSDEGIASVPYTFSLSDQNWVGMSREQLINQMGTPSSTTTLANGNTTYDYDQFNQNGTKSGIQVNTRSVFNLDANGIVTSEYVVIL